MSEFPRPRCCPEPRCRPLFQTPAPDFLVESQDDPRRRDDPPGESWFCWGAMAEPVTFVYDGVKHTNDLRACTFTPLKGLVAFQENYGDWWALKRGYHKAIERLEKLYPERMPQPDSKQSEQS